MKHSIFAIVTLAGMGAASAQTAASSVEVFGVADVAYSVGNGDLSNRSRLTSGAQSTSRLGFRGGRSFANGLKASFWFEAGVNADVGSGTATNSNNQTGTALADTGTQGVTFNRRSTVSLSGGFGEIRAGRDFAAHYLNVGQYDTFGVVGVGASRPFVLSNAGVSFTRVSNSIAYFTPSFGGFRFEAQTYLGENSSTASDIGSGSSFRASFDQGPLSLGVAYGKTNTGATTDVQYSNLGGSYDFGAAKIMAFVSKESNTKLADVNGYLVGVRVPAGPGYVRASVSNTDNGTAKSNQVAAGYVYNLDKQTDIYVTVATLNNSGGATAALNASTVKANSSSSGYDIGIKYAF
ncbi:MAG: porin [Pseudomonadota bacterium]